MVALQIGLAVTFAVVLVVATWAMIYDCFAEQNN
ncbi:hypothetical protein Tfer_0731 [Thermincola ferriacetica]|uniref:Uncharacterized protein n=2 Tax=Thermincola TaxID=278993 RepID=D5X9G7_THEPJ|nr:hypothetical protein TherJR_2228 [Thermincola potens JR]KNZ70547.1 hypothetical protein Tfer_0731 [Thermincola ferriacetica]